MELSDIITLVKAGYTKDEISKMVAPVTAADNTEPVPVDPPAPTPEPVPTPANEPAAAATAPVVQAPQQEQPGTADILQAIAKLTSAVQANAIAQSVLPAGATGQPKPEDMIAEIIRPTFHERG